MLQRYQDKLGRRRGELFLLAGVCTLISGIALGVEWLTIRYTLANGPLGRLEFVGIIASYIGLLGLLTRMERQTARLAVAIIGVMAIPVIIISIDLIAITLGFSPPLGSRVSMLAIIGVATGFAIFGILGFRDNLPLAGLSLIMYGFAWALSAGFGLYLGYPLPEWIQVGSTLIAAIALISIGIVYRTPKTGRSENTNPFGDH